MENNADYDKTLYSRQVYAVGAEAQKKYSETDILLIGLSGLGVEIAKNLVLTGVRSVTLIDHHLVTYYDLSTNFYVSEADIGKRRSTAALMKLSELNSYVRVCVCDEALSLSLIEKFTCVIAVDIGFSTKEIKELNSWTRSAGAYFISCESKGVCANIFTDFGPNFTVIDKDGIDYPVCLVTSISCDGLVLCHDDKPHQLQNGDMVVFTSLPESTQIPCNVELSVRAVHTPYNFSLQLPACHSIVDSPFLNGYVKGVKQHVSMHFKSLDESIIDPSFAISDFGKMDAPSDLHYFFQALHHFVVQHDRMPSAGDDSEARWVIDKMKAIHGPEHQTSNENLFLEFARTSMGNFVGMTAFIGGLAAHEALKAASGKYTPIHQWFYFDARECLPASGSVTSAQRKPKGSRYDAQIAIFGDHLHSQFLDQRLFIVGAGALGCELLKNVAMCGLGCGPSGGVIITDMDLIEKSNLSRQFLFRTKDIGSMKSECAANAAKGMNSSLHVTALQEKVSDENSSIFDDAFWDSVNCVCTALDNLSARIFVDSQCVKYRKSMIDSGTLGSKANVQVVIPYLTESYASSQDPPEKSVPVCTLKNFPTAIEHTIQWARDAFEGIFSTQINEVQQYLTNTAFIDTLESTEPAQLPFIINNIVSTLKHVPTTFDDCIIFARLRFEEFFFNTISQLLYNFPLDSVTSSNAPFWSGPKKPPVAISFDADVALHVDFVEACAKLRAHNFSLEVHPAQKSRAYVISVASTVNVPTFAPKKVRIETDENAKNTEQDSANITHEKKDLPVVSHFKDLVPHLSTITFEKDDDSNYHIAFITACSNLRASNYKIPTSDFDQTKLIAGRIIPAMVTTTALVTGLVLLELAKIVCHPKDTWTCEMFRNAFVSLEIALTAFSDPVGPVKNYYGPPDDEKKYSWTLWDRFEVDLGRDITLKELLDYMMKEYNLEVNMMSCGQGLIYSFFGSSSQARLQMPLSKAVESVTKQEIPSAQTHLMFEVVCAMDDADVDVPAIRYRFRHA